MQNGLPHRGTGGGRENEETLWKASPWDHREGLAGADGRVQDGGDGNKKEGELACELNPCKIGEERPGQRLPGEKVPKYH